MADSCPIGIWVTDAQGATRFANRMYRGFCGVASEQLNRGGWELLLDQIHEPEFVEAFDRALREHTPFKAEERNQRADGEWRWMESYAEPRFSPSGEFLGLSGTSSRTLRNASKRSKPCKAARRSFASWRKIFVKSFG